MTSENKRRKGKNSHYRELGLRVAGRLKRCLFYKRKDRVELNKEVQSDE